MHVFYGIRKKEEYNVLESICLLFEYCFMGFVINSPNKLGVGIDRIQNSFNAEQHYQWILFVEGITPLYKKSINW